MKSFSVLILLLLFATTTIAGERVLKRYPDHIELKVKDESPTYCDEMAIDKNKNYRPTKVCLDAEDKTSIKVDTKVFEAITKKDWFLPAKTMAPLQHMLGQITFKCFPPKTYPARVVHRTSLNAKIDLELDCGLKDTKQIEKYMQQLVEYLKELSTPEGKTKITEEIGKKHTACLEGKVTSKECESLKLQWRQVLSGNISNKNLEPAVYCDLQLGLDQSKPLTYTVPLVSVTDDKRKCNENGINCRNQDGKQVGYWEESRDKGSYAEDGSENKVGFWKMYCGHQSQPDCVEGFYENGQKVGYWKGFCAPAGCGGGEYRNGEKTGKWKQNCDEDGCDEGSYINDQQVGHWKESCFPAGCGEGEYKDGNKIGRWKHCSASGCHYTLYKENGEYEDIEETKP